ncbi:MAG: hypothetical protein JRH20_21920, partial [Deltaproteobacteria bacterium]|nr:hypothetical protein [Deltaproteobacteria bacterium]
MSILGYHMVCRFKDNRVIAATPEERLQVTRIVLERGRPFRLLVFCLVDSHLHFEVAESFALSMELSRRIEVAITHTLAPPTKRGSSQWREEEKPIGFAPAFPTAIQTQAHLSKAFEYILRQREHHGLSWDAHAAASSLPDLLGLRLFGEYTADVVRELLPRVDRHLLLRHLGVEQLEPANGPLEFLHRAVCATLGLTTLVKRTRLVRAAQRAAVKIAGSRLQTLDLAEILEVRPRTVQRMRKEEVDVNLEQAIRLQLALHAAI